MAAVRRRSLTEPDRRCTRGRPGDSSDRYRAAGGRIAPGTPRRRSSLERRQLAAVVAPDATRRHWAVSLGPTSISPLWLDLTVANGIRAPERITTAAYKPIATPRVCVTSFPWGDLTRERRSTCEVMITAAAVMASMIVASAFTAGVMPKRTAE